MFIFSILFLFVAGSCWALMDIIRFPIVVPGIISCIVCIIGMFCIPLTLNNFRTSMIMKRLGNSRITSYTFIFTVTFFYLLMSILSLLWMLGWGFIVFCNNIDRYLDVFRYMNVPELLYTFVISFLVSASFGMFFLVFTKRNFVIALVAAIITIFGFVLSGFAAPISLVHNFSFSTVSSFHIVQMAPISPFVYVHPMWYTTSMSYEAFFAYGNDYYSFTTTSIFNPTQMVLSKTIYINPNPQIILMEGDKWANLFVPLALIVIFGGTAIGRFKWNVR